MTVTDDLLARILDDPETLAHRQAEADRLIAASGAAHLVQELAGQARNRPWRLDPVPFVLTGDQFDVLADAVAERLQGMEELVADLYGPRRVVREGIVPAEALAATPSYRLASVGTPAPRRWLTTYAVDLALGADGRWRVVQDLTDTPTGVGYALLDRSVMARMASEFLGDAGSNDLASISGFTAELRHALATTTSVASPRMVLFTGGVEDAAYVEHSALARHLGFNLVERPDLVVRAGRLWLRTLGGLDPIDVVYRRVEDSAVDPIEIQSGASRGVPGLLAARAEGGVSLANAHGAGVLEDRQLAPFWAEAIDALIGHRPRLELLAEGDDLAESPVVRHGRVGAAAVVVRMHVVAGVDGVNVMAGGNGRVLAPGDDPRRPSAHLAKDVWVLGADRTAPVIVAPPLPQVDLATSVPTRAADALYWVGRHLERAEAIARTARVIAGRRLQDPALVNVDDGRWARRMAEALRAVREADATERVLAEDPPAEPAPVDQRPVAVLQRELVAAIGTAGTQLDALVVEAASVGEYMSGTTSRVLNRLAKLRASFGQGRAPIDVLDDVLEQLAALAGLWAESTVRGPAWWFGDLGRRLERARVVVALVDALAAADLETDDGGVDMVASSALEIMLSANESLVAYRRHHRSDVERTAALELLIDDVDNPRSLAACLHRLGEAVAALAWEDGMRAAAALSDERPSLERLDEFAALVDETWFATPVNPVVMRGADGVNA